jgi:hypothetical protein
MHRRHHDSGDNDIYINYHHADDKYHAYVDHDVKHYVVHQYDAASDDDGTEYVLVRRDHLDNLARAVDVEHDAHHQSHNLADHDVIQCAYLLIHGPDDAMSARTDGTPPGPLRANGHDAAGGSEAPSHPLTDTGKTP